MRIAVISDVHGNYDALQLVLKDMNSKKIDEVIVLGDIIFRGKEPRKCFEAIRELKPLVWILGNTDNWVNEIKDDFLPKDEKEEKIYENFNFTLNQLDKESIDFMKILPSKQYLDIGTYRILCVHGSDKKINAPVGTMTKTEDLDDLFERLDADIMVCGHTHLPFTATKKKKLLMNVGTVGLADTGYGPSYGILDIDTDSFEYSIRNL
jgi:putative phosphoesterase